MTNDAITDWREVKLGDVCSSISDTYHGNDEQVILINTSDVLDGMILNHVSVKNEKLKGQFKKTFQKDDILYSEIRPANRRFAFVDIEKTSNYIASTKLMVIRPDKNKILPRFLYTILKSDDLINELQHLAETRSGTFPQITFSSELAPMKVLLPPVEVQRKIAGVLGALDDKIELNNKINQNLELQAQALFKSWFVDFEPFGGTIPSDWKEIQLTEIADFIGGYSYKGAELKQSTTAMATIKNFDRNGGFKLDGYKEIEPSSKLKQNQYVELFDTLVAHTDLTQNAEVIGNAEMLLSKGKYKNVIISMDVVRVVPKNGISKYLLAAILKDPHFKKHCLGYVNGTTVLHLSKRALPEYSLIFPKNVKILDNISGLFEDLYKKIALNIEENIRLSILRDTLLPKLMSGEIDVDNVEISDGKE